MHRLHRSIIRRSRLAAVIAIAAVASAVVVPASLASPLGGTAAVAKHPAAISVAPRSPASATISAHDGKFYAGSTPIRFHGLNFVPGLGTSQADIQRVAAWGVNFIRLRMRWALVEPNPPVLMPDGTWVHSYDPIYMARAIQTIQWASQEGIYVNVSFHGCDPNDYGCPYFGFPDWLYKAKYNSHQITYAQTVPGEVQAATDFWTDPLRQQFWTETWRYLAAQLKAIPGVMSYELLNEPDSGSLPAAHSTTQLILDQELKVAKAIRAIDPSKVIVFTTRAGYGPGIPAADLTGFAALGNCAFDVHDYTGARWGNGLVENPKKPVFVERLQDMWIAVNQADAPPYIGTTYGHVRFIQDVLNQISPWGMPLIVGEMGALPGDPGIYNYFGTTTAAFQYLDVSWATFYSGHLGIVGDSDQLLPWSSIVIEALQH
jgi:hypothetical protein